MPAQSSVVLAQYRFELAAMGSAGIAVWAVDAAAVPGEPAAGLGIYVLAVAEIKHLVLQRNLGLRVRMGAAELASEYHCNRH